MDFSLSNFAKPILASPQDLERPIYSDDTWNKMLGYKFEGPFNATTSTKLYVNAMQDAHPNRKFNYNSQVVSSQAKLSHESSHETTSKPKAIAAMASWCGFSKKAHAKHQEYNTNIQTLWCDKQDKNHALCKKTRGFPTYYNVDGSVMKSGYPVKDPKSFYEALK